MNINLTKGIFSVICAAVTITGFAGAASAIGQGGVAGSAAFELADGVVTTASAAVAIGKSTAYAGATTTSGTEAFAAGTGGAMTLATTGLYIDTIEEDSALETVQANELKGSKTDIDAVNGTIDQSNCDTCI